MSECNVVRVHFVVCYQLCFIISIIFTLTRVKGLGIWYACMIPAPIGHRFYVL